MVFKCLYHSDAVRLIVNQLLVRISTNNIGIEESAKSHTEGWRDCVVCIAIAINFYKNLLRTCKVNFYCKHVHQPLGVCVLETLVNFTVVQITLFLGHQM